MEWKKEKKDGNYFEYKFGDVVKNDKKVECYKIEKGGRITVYIPIMNTVTKDTINLEYDLKLKIVNPGRKLKIFVFTVVLLGICYYIL
jgi:hypothetical protein